MEDKEVLKREKYHGEETEAYRADLARLEGGEPLAYVLGYQKFLGCKIDLSFRPMIPRFETGFWVEHAIEELDKKERSLRLADTFSGSGCIGVAVLRYVPNATLEFSELDPNLHEQIIKNVALNKIDSARARVFTADGFEALTGEYDAIFANPPYIPHGAELDPEMIEHEPHLAFFAGKNGLAYLEEIISTGEKFLKPGGTLYVEADTDQHDDIVRMIESSSWKSYEFWKDPYGAEPFLVLRKDM